MHYVRHGSVPHQRHTQHRAPDGALYAEELFGVEGFVGRSSLLYHLVPPTRTHRIEAGPLVTPERADERLHHHRLIKTAAVPPGGDIVGGRIALFFNRDVVLGVVRPAQAMAAGHFYRNGEGDELLFVHEGSGRLDSVFGTLDYGPGDYLVIPIGTTWRLEPTPGVEQRLLWLETPGEIEPPRRYRNEYGQLLEHAPYYHRDIHPPAELHTHRDRGDHVVKVRVSGGHQT
ncbi:MAG: homogentisate 1,2-dioxygenase, partial [Candidatus Limnocylindrales bacterium]